MPADDSSRGAALRAAVAGTLPTGTVPVGIGLVLSGLTAYGFLVVAARALGPERYAGLSVLWALLFLLGPGAFFPVEQETTRALSARIARGLGVGPVIRRAGTAGIGLAAAMSAGIALAWGPFISDLLDDDRVLGLALVIGLIGLSGQHVLRGTLAGTGRFAAYGTLLGLEGTLRLGASLGLVVVGATSEGAFGLVLAVPAALTALLILPAARGLLDPGPEAPWKEISGALGYLLTGSLLAQFVVNAGPLAVRILAAPSERAAVSRFLSGLIIARVPLFLFLAIQAAVLPRLSALVSSGDVAGFRRGLRRLLETVAVVGVLAIIGAFAVGPQVQSLLFGEAFGLGRTDMALLAAGTAAFMLALATGQALIALTAYARLVLGWAIGATTLVIVTALGSGLLLRVELGFLFGAGAAAVVLVGLLSHRLADPEHLVPGPVVPPGQLPVEP